VNCDYMKTRNNLVRKEVLKIVIPPLLAISLFVAAVFFFAIPFFENNLIEQKKNMLSNLIHLGINVLEYYNREALSGRLTRNEAMAGAVKQLREHNFGPDNKDYFWINDMRPRMIMHPYRSDLEGQDVSEFADPQGKRLFFEMVKVVNRSGAGYIDYHWQWKDDPGRIEKKLSYVMLYKPWDWIIGTGVYIEDVKIEIALIVKELLFISAAIFLIIFLISVYIVRNNLKEIQKRLLAEGEIVTYRDHLEVLVKKRTAELEDAMSQVKVLSGFLPICSSCKKIRDDSGYWNQIELYIRDHSEAQFSHGICPDCAKKLYAGLYKRDE